MRLSKGVLVVRLEKLQTELYDMRDMLEAVTEQTRAVDAIETDAWCSIEFSRERLDTLAAHMEILLRDVLSDL